MFIFFSENVRLGEGGEGRWNPTKYWEIEISHFWHLSRSAKIKGHPPYRKLNAIYRVVWVTKIIPDCTAREERGKQEKKFWNKPQPFRGWTACGKHEQRNKGVLAEWVTSNTRVQGAQLPSTTPSHPSPSRSGGKGGPIYTLKVVRVWGSRRWSFN